MENRIKLLPIELQNYIYEYIHTDMRIRLILNKYTISKIIMYFSSMTIKEQVECFKYNFQDKILNSKGRIKDDLLRYVPYTQYQNYRGDTIRSYNNIVSIITPHCNINYIYSRLSYIKNNYCKQATIISRYVINLISIFSTLHTNFGNAFINKVQSILLKFLLAILVICKKKYNKKIEIKQTIQLRYYMKKHIFKPLMKRARLYAKNAIKARKEVEKRKKQTERFEKRKKKGKKVIIRRKLKICK